MTCKLCGLDKRLIKAHVIPEAFFRIGRQPGEESPVMASSDPTVPPKRAPIGVYDKQLVCGECESRFQDWDNYGARVFIGDWSTMFKPWESDGQTIAYLADEIDYRLLKLFAMSVLWRAAESSHEYFRRISLGPWSSVLRQLLLNSDPGTPAHFSVLFSRWSAAPDRPELANTHMSPFKERWDGVNAVRLYLGPVAAYIKVDQRPFPRRFDPLLLRPDAQLAIVVRDIHTSKDLKAMEATVSNFVAWQGRRG